MPLSKLFHLRVRGVFGLTQQISKFVDRVSPRTAPGGQAWNPFDELVQKPELDDVHRLVGIDDLWGAAALFKYQFREKFLERFFEGTVGTIGSLLTDVCPHAEEELIASAERLCKGRFDLLGYRDLSFGDPVDWHLDPLARRRVPLEHWSAIDPFDSSMVGDCTLIWALNRHQWLVTLGQAYRLTADERYARHFDETVRDWIRTNPVGMGINWVDTAEISFRLMAWCWALALFRESPALTPDLFALLLDTIRAHAVHVERYLSYHDAPNTHLTAESLGLFYVGTLFQELRPADRWRTLGYNILVEELRTQTSLDGIHFDQSTCYQSYTVDIYLQFLILATINGIPVPWFVTERLQAMLDAMIALRRPDGTVPYIGDGDGGRLLPLTTRWPGDCRDTFAVAAVLFQRADYAWAAEGATSEILWLFGLRGLEEFEALKTDVPARRSSQSFPSGGYVVMRSGWDRTAHHLIFDVGPLASAASPGHGHADLLSIQCSAYGETFIIDPGLSGYADPEWRAFFRSTTAHSTIMVDKKEQADPAGSFSWKRMPQARLRQWIANDMFELADADHDAYRRLPDPVQHRRRILFVKRRYWILVDDLSAKEPHRIDLLFHFAPLAVELNALRTIARTAAGPGLYVVPYSGTPLQAELLQGEEMPFQGWYAPIYGRRVPAPMVRYSVSAPFPVRIVTLLYPVPDRNSAVPDVVVEYSDTGRPDVIMLRDRNETIVIGDHMIVVQED